MSDGLTMVECNRICSAMQDFKLEFERGNKDMLWEKTELLNNT